MKKILAIVLAFAMVLGGIYWVDNAGAETKAATEANTDMLNVKAQVATDASNVIRFVTSVDSLDYSNVGFEVTPEGGATKTYTTTKVYERIASTEEAVEYTFSPKVVDTSSEYFVTAKLRATAGVDYTVKAFATQKNGEKIYGATRCVAVEDGKSTTTLNLTYEATTAPTKGSTIDVTYGSDNKATTAKVIAVDGKNVSVRVNVNASTLPSATKFTFGTTGSAIYRNLYTKYTGTNTADTTWYSVYLADNANETEFTIATNADMYGFMNLYAGKNLFKNKTLYVISDIAMNDNVTKATVESWANGTEAPYKWTPSGNDSANTRFQGTFDGQMHTLSGFYVNEDSTYAGMFGSTDGGSVIKNFYLEDSYFTTTGGLLSGGGDVMFAYLGSVAGENRGTIENIYSNAIVASAGQRTGGIIGVHNTTTAVANAGMQAIVDNCWFDGEVRLLDETGKVGGGIVGMVQQRESTISNVLFTGKVTAQTTGEAAIGGLVGTENNNCTINMLEAVSVGTVTAGTDATAIGGAVGKVNRTASVHYMVNVYSDSAMGVHVGLNAADYPGLAIAKTSLYGTTAYQKTLLDYEGTWGARANATPVLRTFTEKYNASDIVTDFTGVAQNQWYDANMKAYGIHTVSAFKAFRDYSNDTQSKKQFKGMYVCLLDDLNMNPGWTAPKSVDEAVTGNPEKWTPISAGGSVEFLGIFDGKQHTISGVYVNSSAHYATIFGQCLNAQILNLKVTNSYFKQTGSGNAWAASVVGVLYGDGTNAKLTNIYSDAIVVTEGYQTGGIAGRAEALISNCWFDGEIVSTRNGRVGIGGIVGVSRHRSGITVKDCLNTGKVIYRGSTTSYIGIGGIYGCVEASTIGVTIENCINAGTVEIGTSFTGVGAIAGYIGALAANSTYAIKNCYARTDSVKDRTTTATEGIFGGAASSYTGTCTGHTVKTLNEMKGAGAELFTNLDFDTTWAKRANDVPVPSVFIGWIVE